jgi:4-amino-4-deoxy-L-arabinose transferase-like glycosyltransferase
MKAKPFSISKHLPVLFLLVFLSFFAHLGYLPLFDADEGAYSEVTREMLENQDFTSVQLNGMPFPHKPPLFFWAQAASIKILGLNEFGLRLPSAIAALLWVSSIFLFTRRYYDTRSGWYAGQFMASSLLVTIIGRAAVPEALFNLFLTLTLLNIYRFYHTGNKRHIYWSFMFCALGILTKGAIAILLPFGVSLIFFGSKRRWKDLIRLFFNPVGLMVFGLIVIPWYLGEFMLHGEAFLSDLLMLPGMETSQYDFIGSSLPYYTYPVFIFLGLLPFCGMLIKAFFHLKRLLSDDLIKFLLIWFFLAFLLLPLAQPKSIFSIVCCLPPLFIIMARVADSFRHPVNLFVWPFLGVIVLLLAPYLAPYMAGSIGNEFARTAITEAMVYFDPFYRVTLGILLLLLGVLPFIKPVSPSVKYSVLGLLFVSMVNFLILPIIGNTLQLPVKSAGLLAQNENLTVITWRIDQPSFNVYAETLTTARPPQTGDIVLTKSAYLKNGLTYETIFARQGIILAKFLEIPANRPMKGPGDNM